MTRAERISKELKEMHDQHEILELKNKGNESYICGKYDEALVYFNKELEISPDSINALNDKGLTLMKLGRIAEAKQCLELMKSLRNKKLAEYEMERSKSAQNNVQYDEDSIEEPAYPIVDKQWQNKSISEGNLSIIRPVSQEIVPIILKKNETCYGLVTGAQFWEDRAVRNTYGGYGGPRIHIAKGVSFSLGGFGSQGESHQERRHIDTGHLVVTDKRLVFVGNSKTIEFPVSKILSCQSIPDKGIIINRSGKQKTEYYLGGYDSDLINAVIHGVIKNSP